METHNMVLSFLAIFLFFSSIPPVMSRSHANSIGADTKGTNASRLQTYIVQVRPPPSTQKVANAGARDLENWYRSFLPTAAANSSIQRMVYMYRDAITGFAARLTEEEVKDMARRDGFLKAYPDRTLPLLTTHTPAFLGLDVGSGFWNGSGFGKGVIIGVLDTGIHADHPSFDDKGMPPPPSKWKGSCESILTGCNNKVIGARAFNRGAVTAPYDSVGHGTHTASTAAGNFVKKATVLGNGNGTAVGMAPRAHLAIYKVCYRLGCTTSDVMAGMDAAIRDGVDVLSLSLGGEAAPFYEDAIAIAAFSATEKGIFVSCAAGNSGPDPGTVENDAPWILTVGASTMDRNIRATVKLGGGQEIDGETLFQPHDFSSTALPLVYPVTQGGVQSGNCVFGALYGIDIKGKVVLCMHDTGSRTDTGSLVKEAGGAAMIIANRNFDGYTTFAQAHHLPASQVSYADGLKIISYINSTNQTTASIVFKGTITGISPAPTVAYFSSRGPSKITPGILKPDIIGPGVNVLAAWPFEIGQPSKNHAKLIFNIISGTSMSTPHLSGIAALVKGAHPDWSPAAIKSAIMTTSDIICKDGKPIVDEQHKPASFFLIGAGHVNPSKAADPGLVYDLGVEDYIPYLCGMGYSDAEVETVTHHNVTCAKIKKIAEAELNYPSISVALQSKHVTVNRTVTNVGEASSTYSVKVDVPKGVSVSVIPEKLVFSEFNEKKSFTVSINWRKSQMHSAEGNLEWVSHKHVVRSPIVIS